ncbi:hypothetical protein T265_01057 [Opisthorchis viverrini]|uniref:Uncharacterized protein n=1 Tax=Opisthorchis viverrini TaxID=6198 RepID=A0A075AAX1_OPIVI|nr:hypothetical protein T265_01057 [Opisthorchis viverrini]KER32965.1 hypothetical protein T265_01057 [Opisthorchis viverrini]
MNNCARTGGRLFKTRVICSNFALIKAMGLPLLHRCTQDESGFPHMNRRTCSRLSNVIGSPDL